jgi:hypothetical protein
MNIPRIIVVADRGEMKIYEVDHFRESPRRRPPLRLIDQLQIEEAHQKYAERFTDRAGSFPNQRSAHQGNSAAERLPLREETESRILRRLADHLGEVLRAHESPAWALAASAEVSRALLEQMDSMHRRNLRQQVPRDLVKTPVANLLEHFETDSVLTK